MQNVKAIVLTGYGLNCDNETAFALKQAGAVVSRIHINALIDRVAEDAGVQAGCRVCDVGCGYGGTSRRLAAKYQAQATGLTISPAQHRYAVQATDGADNPTYLLRNWEQIKSAFWTQSSWGRCLCSL